METKNEKKTKISEIYLNENLVKLINVARKIIGVFIILYGIYGGVMLSIMALVGIASATHVAAWAYIVQFLVLALFIGLSCLLGLWIFGTKKKTK